MDFRKLIAGSSLVFLLSGCQLWDDITGTASQISSEQEPKDVIMEAFSKLQNDLKQSHSEIALDVAINTLEPTGTIKISLDANEDQAPLKEKGDLNFSFSTEGNIKDNMQQQGGPEAGKAVLSFVRKDLDFYFNAKELKLEPEEMNSFVEMFFPNISETWYYLDMTKLAGMEGIDAQSLENLSMTDAIAKSIVNSAEQEGKPISEDAAKKIATKMLSGEYLDVIDTEATSNGIIYTAKVDYEGLKNVIKEISEIIAQETGEASAVDDEKMDAIIAKLKEKTSDVEVKIGVNNQGYLTSVMFDHSFDFTEDEGAPVKSVDVSFEMQLSKFNEDFDITIPENYQDLTGMMEMMGASPYGSMDDTEDFDFDGEMGFSDFYPCDYYDCVEETEDRIVDSDGDVWVKDADGAWSIATQ